MNFDLCMKYFPGIQTEIYDIMREYVRADILEIICALGLKFMKSFGNVLVQDYRPIEVQTEIH